MGRDTQAGPNPNEVEVNVTRIIVHPDYNNTLLNNDIALMKLGSNVTYTNYIRPICLASNSSQFHNSTSCWSTGWGQLTANSKYLAGFPSSFPAEMFIPPSQTKNIIEDITHSVSQTLREDKQHDSC